MYIFALKALPSMWQAEKDRMFRQASPPMAGLSLPVVGALLFESERPRAKALDLGRKEKPSSFRWMTSYAHSFCEVRPKFEEDTSALAEPSKYLSYGELPCFKPQVG